MGQTQTIYDALNQAVLSLVPSTAGRILDIGCGTGVFGERLRQQRERYVAGITYSAQEAELASERLSQVYRANLNDFDFAPLGRFDCVILSHILEHLQCPEALLEHLKDILTPDAVIIVALPNVLWWKQRLKFIVGQWRYEDWGILDRTHFRFFDKRSSAELLETTGYEILRRKYDGPFPLIKPVRGLLGRSADTIDHFTSRLLPGLLATQFVYLAQLKR